MSVMRQLISDLSLLSYRQAAVGGCGKVGRPRHYLKPGLGGGKAQKKDGGK